MIYIYLLAFFISMVMLIYVLKRQRLQNIFLVLMATVLSFSNAGYLALAVSTNIKEAILANKVTYIGGCFLPLLMFLLTTYMCKVKLHSKLQLVLVCYSFFVMGCVLSIGFSDIYYKSVELHSYKGLSYITKTYGPAHNFYIISLYGYILAIAILLIYSLFRKSIVSYKTVLCLGVSLISNAMVNLLERQLYFKIDMVPLTYDISLIIIALRINKIDMYDMSANVLKVLDRIDEYGYITFDNMKRYIGSNELAKHLFPSLSSQKIDFPIEKLDNTQANEIFTWVNQYQMGITEEVKIYEINDMFVKFTLKGLNNRKNKQIGYLLEFYDVTQEQKYVRMIENYNTDLERQVETKTKDILHVRDMMILGMASMVESRDNSTGGHIRRTSEVVRIFASKLEDYVKDNHLPDNFLENVIKAAPIHDLGKIAVDDRILRKNGMYTQEEFDMMKAHTTEGAKIVDEIFNEVEEESLMEIARNVAHYHHERWDGKGYPEGLQGELIPIEARIMALADVFDSLVSVRCYKQAFTFEEAYQIIKESLGTHFDPELGKIFLTCYPKLEALYRNQ